MKGVADEDEDLLHGVERCMYAFIPIACMDPNKTVL